LTGQGQRWNWKESEPTEASQVEMLFLEAVKANNIQVMNENVSGLSQPCEEFGFRSLSSKHSPFHDIHSFKDSADAEARSQISALEERDAQQEWRSRRCKRTSRVTCESRRTAAASRVRRGGFPGKLKLCAKLVKSVLLVELDLGAIFRDLFCCSKTNVININFAQVFC
jgi:hypothetical protein